MASTEREKPLDWCEFPSDWPGGPFRRPPSSTHDLVTVEQQAALAVEIQTRLRQVRTKQGMGKAAITHEELEDLADVGRGTVSALMGGHKWFSFEVLCRLAAAMGSRLTLTEWQVAEQAAARQPQHMPERTQWPQRVEQSVAIENAYTRRREMPPIPESRGELRSKKKPVKRPGQQPK